MEMKRGFLFLGFILFGFMLFVLPVLSVDSGSDSMIVEANILQQEASVQVPDYIFFGDITKGYSTNSTKVYVNNTGTVDIMVTPQLQNASEIYFSYLSFRNRTSDSWRRVGNYSGILIPRPSEMGDFEYDYFYMQFNLSSFPDSIDNNMIGHQAEIIFWAMPR